MLPHTRIVFITLYFWSGYAQVFHDLRTKNEPPPVSDQSLTSASDPSLIVGLHAKLLTKSVKDSPKAAKPCKKDALAQESPHHSRVLQQVEDTKFAPSFLEESDEAEVFSEPVDNLNILSSRTSQASDSELESANQPDCSRNKLGHRNLKSANQEGSAVNPPGAKQNDNLNKAYDSFDSIPADFRKKFALLFKSQPSHAHDKTREFLEEAAEKKKLANLGVENLAGSLKIAEKTFFESPHPANDVAESSSNNAGPNPARSSGSNFANNAGPYSATNAGPNFANNAETNSANNAAPNFLNNEGPNFANNAIPNVANNAGPNSANNAGPNFANNAGLNSAYNVGPNFANNAGPKSANNAGPKSANNAGPYSATNAVPNTANNAGTNSANNAAPNFANNAGPNSANSAGPNFANNAGANTANNSGPNSSNNAVMNSAANANSANNVRLNQASQESTSANIAYDQELSIEDNVNPNPDYDAESDDDYNEKLKSRNAGSNSGSNDEHAVNNFVNNNTLSFGNSADNAGRSPANNAGQNSPSKTGPTTDSNSRPNSNSKSGPQSVNKAHPNSANYAGPNDAKKVLKATVPGDNSDAGRNFNGNAGSNSAYNEDLNFPSGARRKSNSDSGPNFANNAKHTSADEALNTANKVGLNSAYYAGRHPTYSSGQNSAKNEEPNAANNAESNSANNAGPNYDYNAKPNSANNAEPKTADISNNINVASQLQSQPVGESNPISTLVNQNANFSNQEASKCVGKNKNKNNYNANVEDHKELNRRANGESDAEQVADPEFREGVPQSLLPLSSSRICYACSTASNPYCASPDKRTTVKYCANGHDSCITKIYNGNGVSILTRDCGSTCQVVQGLQGFHPKYAKCSVCHSDLCNSAFSLNGQNIIFICTVFLVVAFKNVL